MINRDEKNELRKNKVAIKITIGDVKELRRSYVRLTKSFNEFIVDSAKENENKQKLYTTIFSYYFLWYCFTFLNRLDANTKLLRCSLSESKMLSLSPSHDFSP